VRPARLSQWLPREKVVETLGRAPQIHNGKAAIVS
jgi:hypothetical protein